MPLLFSFPSADIMQMMLVSKQESAILDETKWLYKHWADAFSSQSQYKSSQIFNDLKIWKEKNPEFKNYSVFFKLYASQSYVLLYISK